jgi:LacI family transcriptional regulator
MLDNGLPIVFFDRVPQELNCSHVVVDDHDGAFKAVELLVKKGCKQIVHLAGPMALGISDDRLEGYLDCLKANDIAVDNELIVRCEEGSHEESYEITQKLIEHHPEIDGIFANHDMSALGAMLALQEAGIEIPNKVKVVGFSDWQLSQVIKPNLSTVSQPGYEMGRQAAEILMEEIESEKCLGIRKELKTSMIERQST